MPSDVHELRLLAEMENTLLHFNNLFEDLDMILSDVIFLEQVKL